ncbi:hypothetical protein Hanom_Chr09g00776951 [Helianthus anomalus]
MWFGQFFHFSPNLKPFKFGYLWFAFCCHSSPNLKNSRFLLFQHAFFVFLCRGIFVQVHFIKIFS